MKATAALVLMTALWFLPGSASLPTGALSKASSEPAWGRLVDGIQMSLSVTNPRNSEIQVALRNVGDHDVSLNLGFMIAADAGCQMSDTGPRLFSDI